MEQKDDPVVYMIEEGMQSTDTAYTKIRKYGSQWSTVLSEVDARCTSSVVQKNELVSSYEKEDKIRRRDIFNSLTTEFGA